MSTTHIHIAVVTKPQQSEAGSVHCLCTLGTNVTKTIQMSSAFENSVTSVSMGISCERP